MCGAENGRVEGKAEDDMVCVNKVVGKGVAYRLLEPLKWESRNIDNSKTITCLIQSPKNLPFLTTTGDHFRIGRRRPPGLRRPDERDSVELLMGGLCSIDSMSSLKPDG